ncbi:FtsQ-type POTRA domain-containing protein [Gryllotalpicola protaetiae]|uniref:FtsQ-type POTRA domain-containing protein n=1 Tax=Gryllotalpicola protaetiae TaxID=2419771 RepID=A0A387BV63_9MICO|nr:FtsQ-type POTRA domain-containing protein [Gryllotalpicola protaetiae]AYG04757.1 FtsQ-type POTRA domain-containing protein [Gryllotalpicola protaetiae]
MRRPSGPVQRAPQPPQASTATREPDAEPRRAAEPARPVDLTPRIETPARPEKQGEKGEPDATQGRSSGLGSWREVRRAVAARRKVERGEARRFTARTRRRRQLQFGIAGFVVLVLGGAVVTAYSPVMALRHIEVVGTHNVAASDVQQALRGELGTPLPLVKSADVRHALDDFRLIESYSTQLEPPSTLVVRITERTPLAVVKQGSSYEVVDQAGVVLSAGATPQAGLPVVTVPAGQEPQDSAGFAAAAAVIAALPAAVRTTVTGASATGANNVTLTLAGGKQVVWGDTGQMDLKTADLQALLKGAAGASVYDVSSPRAPITR